MTPEGYIYSREAILENLLMQKKAIKRKVSEYEEQEKRSLERRRADAREESEGVVGTFDATNHAPLARSRGDASTSKVLLGDAAAAGAKTAKYENFLAREDKSFWLASKTPEAERTLAVPKLDTVCPSCGKKLRLKDLVSLNFTPASDGDGDGEGRHMCPISMKALTKSSKLVVLRATGDVMTEEAFKTVVKPDGVYKGHRIASSKDVIRIRCALLTTRRDGPGGDRPAPHALTPRH